MLERRTFLTRLASGLVGVSMVDVEWARIQPMRILGAGRLTAQDIAEARTPLSIAQDIAEAAIRAWSARWDRPQVERIFSGTLLGEAGLTSMQCVNLGRGSYGPEGIRHDVDGAVALLDTVVRHHGATRMGALPTPRWADTLGWAAPVNSDGQCAVVATDDRTGLTLRVSTSHDLEHDSTLARIDVVFG